ncbi:MAG: hypothetical protein FWG81_07730 [Betaproteobacteria bacterium]|nr:hypothetical protein [Betaproteobacteria bacterium]
MIAWLLILLALFTPFAALATESAPQGVWSGTLGTKAIVVCFNGSGEGSYYYVAYLDPIYLKKESNYWYEYEPSNKKIQQLDLSVPKNNAITGTWSNLETGKTFPINLTLVDGNDDERACARDSFNLRLEKNIPKVKKGKII